MKFHQKSRNSPEGWKHCSSTTFLPSKWVPLGGKVENSLFYWNSLNLMKFLNFTENRTFSHFSRFRVLSGVWLTDERTKTERGSGAGPPARSRCATPTANLPFPNTCPTSGSLGGTQPPLHSNNVPVIARARRKGDLSIGYVIFQIFLTSITLRLLGVR